MTDQKAPTDMIIDRDVGIKMDDGLILKADIFRPKGGERVPAIMNLGPYCKGLPYQLGYADSWEYMTKFHPEILDGSTCSYLTWETVDPERWVPEGYAIVRVDTRGAGRSPGFMDFYSDRESRDFYECIEWAGGQSWCNGKVGLLGISYYAITQWLVAARQPPHLAAMIPWEGASDHYRDKTHHGGIFCNGFLERWYPNRALPRQHGKKGPMDPWLGEPCNGPETLTEEELTKNRRDYIVDCSKHPLDDDFHKERSADFSKIVIPLMSAGNWGGIGLHNRGNFEGYLRSASKEKWLTVHVGKHEEYFYLRYGRDLQKRFFDHYLKGVSNGWEKEPSVLLTIRYPDKFVDRKENEWPIARTRWTKMYLDGDSMKLEADPIDHSSKISFKAGESNLVYSSYPFDEETEITGPLAAKLYASSSTVDADFFLTLQAFSPEGKEVTFKGANDPNVPLSQGWLRASHRKLDPKLSTPYRPYHSHDEIQALRPGQVYELDVELWPTCIVLPKGYKITLTIAGKDFERRDSKEQFKGSGPFYHTYASDRPQSIFNGITELVSVPGRECYVLLPFVPQKS